MSDRNHWTSLRQRKISRRTMLGASAKAGVGAAGLALVGCGDDDDDAAPAAVDTSAIDAAAGDASAAASAAGEASAAASEASAAASEAAAAASQAADAADAAAALAAEAAESEDAANAAAAAEAAAAAAAQAADAASAAGDAAAAAVADAAAQAAEAAAQAARDAAAAVEAGTATAAAAQAAIDAAAEAAAAAAAAAGEASAAAGEAAATAQETAEAAAETAAAAVAAAQEAAEAAGEAASAAAAAIAAEVAGEDPDFSVPWPLDQVDLDASIVTAATHDSGGLDPHSSASFANDFADGAVFSAALDLDPRDNSVAAHLAMPEWIDPVTIRAAITPAPFHDGSILTAHDVAFSHERVGGGAAYHDGGATTDHPGGWTPANAWAVQGIVRNEAVDDRTWAIEIGDPNLGFLAVSLTAVSNTAVVSRADTERRGDRAVDQSSMGTGPYRFVSHTDDEDFVFERFEDHFLPIDHPVRVPHVPHNKQLTVLVRPELQSRLAGLEAGEIDLVPSLGPDVVEPFLDDPDFTVQFGPAISWAIQNLYPNLWTQTMDDGSPNPFLDVRVRRAANHAINRQSLIDNLLAGVGEQSFVAHSSTEGFPTPEQLQEVTYAYDPGRARALLAEAGYPDGFNTPLYYTPAHGGSYMTDMALAVAQDLTTVGIRVDLVSVPISEYFTDEYVRGKEDAKPGLWWFWGSPIPDISQPWECCAGPRGDWAIAAPPEPDMDEMYNAQKGELDRERRLELITEFILEHARRAYMIFIVEPPSGIMTRSDVNWPKGGPFGLLDYMSTYAAQKPV